VEFAHLITLTVGPWHSKALGCRRLCRCGLSFAYGHVLKCDRQVGIRGILFQLSRVLGVKCEFDYQWSLRTCLEVLIAEEDKVLPGDPIGLLGSLASLVKSEFEAA
jgi:hypothetical protein